MSRLAALLARRGGPLLLLSALLCPGVVAGPRREAAERSPAVPGPDDVIVFTASQSFMSRIYLLRPDGSVITYFHYDNYRFADLEVVDNELFAAEAFAPRVLQVDLHTGDLEVIVDDLWLYYFYGVAFDGTYWYVDEWDLNRYEFDGTKDGMAPFDESVAGSAWDGSHLWTLNNDENLIKCWDLSLWPTVVEIPQNAFAPPTTGCRGLWFDGERLWTAESVEGAVGRIYRFGFDGTVIDEWLAPAFQGWGACVVSGEPFTLSVDRAGLTWNETLGAYAYDVVRGDLGTLRATGGLFAQAVDDCLADDHPPGGLTYTDDPDPGLGHWLLVRGVSTAMALTYDTGKPSQAAPRDAGIDASLSACP